MKEEISQKIIKKIIKGEEDFFGYEKIFDDYKNGIKCRGNFCENFLQFKKTVNFFIEDCSYKDNFYAHLIHDIKSPMVSMDIALRNNKTLFVLEDVYKTNLSNLELIENVLSLYCMRGRVKMSCINVSEILTKIIKNHQYFIEDKKIKIETKLPKIISVKACSVCLERIFSNIFSNAVKFSPVQSVISITFKKRKNDCIVFFKNFVSKKIKQKGNGLGLKILENLAQMTEVEIEKKKFLNTITFGVKFRNMF